jgi:DNA repair protein RecO (recombination protein O)
MKFFKDKAIIVDCIDIQRSDRLVVLYTLHHGLIKGVAGSARQMKSRFLPCFELLNIIELTYVHKEQKELVSISECQVLSSVTTYGEKPEYYFFIFYAAELAKEFALEGVKNTRLFAVLSDIHYGIKHRVRLKILARWTEIQLLHEHGIFPELTACTRCRRDVRKNTESKFLRLNGELTCSRCKQSGDIELAHELFLLMIRLHCAKITHLHTLEVKDKELTQVGAILKLILQQHLEKPLRFYGFYKQLRSSQ